MVSATHFDDWIWRREFVSDVKVGMHAGAAAVALGKASASKNPVLTRTVMSFGT